MPDLGAFLASHIFELIFTGIIGALSWWIRRYIKLEREHNKSEREQFRESILKDSQEEDEQLARKIKELEDQLFDFRAALLSLQGSLFREFCEELLEPGRIIAVDEFEQMEEDYAAYKALGGNHRGDALHSSVVKKFNQQI